MKNLFGLSFVFLTLMAYSKETAKPTVTDITVKNAITSYNSIQNLNTIVKVLSINANDSDKKFLSTLSFDSFPKAKAQGQKIFIEGVKAPIEVVGTAQGFYFLINGNQVEFKPEASIQQTIQNLQRSLEAKYSMYEMFLPRAHALITVGFGVVAYGIGLMVNGDMCFQSWNETKEYLPKEQATSAKEGCFKHSLKWPMNLYNYLVNGDEIQGGTCKKAGNKTTGLDLRIRNAPDDKPISIEINDSTGQFYVAKQTIAGKSRIEAPHWFFGDDKAKAMKFVNELKNICDAGGTEALNKTIREMSHIRKGLSTLKEGQAVKAPEKSSR